MKILTFLTLCAALAGTAAHAAPPAAKPAAKHAAASPAALTGNWKSINADGNALPGTIELRADGHAVLAPQGQPRLEGTWRTKGADLMLDMPPYGVAQMQYAVNAKGLTLTYENGVKQRFTKDTASK